MERKITVLSNKEIAPKIFKLTAAAKIPDETRCGNFVHIQLKGNEENRILCEFRHSEDYSEQTFDIDVKKGKYNLFVTFLPGTDFDLKWIRFNKT